MVLDNTRIKEEIRQKNQAVGILFLVYNLNLDDMIERNRQAAIKEVERLEQEKRDAHFAQVKYWKSNQQKYMSREWDINDPRAIAHDKPPIFNNPGISAAQEFAGEDPN